MAVLTALFLALAATAASGEAAVSVTADIPYGNADWPESFGNHRAVVHVAQQARFVQIRIPWRRRDAKPQDKEIIVVDAKTNQRVANVLRIDINREFGWLLFEPPTAPGDYHVYYMPFRNEGSWYFPTAKYLPPTETREARVVGGGQDARRPLQRGEASAMPTATAVKIEAINEFHRFDPMEVIATAQEMQQLLAANADRPYLLFAEDRKYPIRMTDDLPRAGSRPGRASRSRAVPVAASFMRSR